MPKRLMDVDPLTGLATFHEYDAIAQKNIISYEQDTDGILDEIASVRNDDDVTRRGMKESMLPYAHLPDVVLLKMKFEDGIDPFDPNNGKAVFDLINSKYQRLKLTNLVHRPKN